VNTSATRKVLLEQLGRVLPSDVDSLPDKVFVANTSDHYGARFESLPSASFYVAGNEHELKFRYLPVRVVLLT
jgi:hypothetical protein